MTESIGTTSFQADSTGVELGDGPDVTPPTMRLDRSVHRWTLWEKIRRASWLLVWTTLGSWGPKFLSPFRVALLRLFGARIGSGCLICGNVRVLMPWNLEIGDFSWVGARVDIYNYGKVRIGRQTCVSQDVWLCTGTHDYRRPEFPLRWSPITIGDSVWIASAAFIHPGTRIGNGAVIGARSVVSGEIDAWTIYAGNPARAHGRRVLASSRESGEVSGNRGEIRYR